MSGGALPYVMLCKQLKYLLNICVRVRIIACLNLWHFHLSKQSTYTDSQLRQPAEDVRVCASASVDTDEA